MMYFQIQEQAGCHKEQKVCLCLVWDARRHRNRMSISNFPYLYVVLYLYVFFLKMQDYSERIRANFCFDALVDLIFCLRKRGKVHKKIEEGAFDILVDRHLMDNDTKFGQLSVGNLTVRTDSKILKNWILFPQIRHFFPNTVRNNKNEKDHNEMSVLK